jgi:hypothetical protein
MQDDPDAAGDAGADPGADGADDGSTEFCVVLAADGSLSCYVEAGEDESAEQGATPVKSIGEALKWVLQQYQQKAGGGASAMSAQAGFDASTKARA